MSVKLLAWSLENAFSDEGKTACTENQRQEFTQTQSLRECVMSYRGQLWLKGCVHLGAMGDNI